jgi:hypothetical protein
VRLALVAIDQARLYYAQTFPVNAKTAPRETRGQRALRSLEPPAASLERVSVVAALLRLALG